MNHRVLSFLGVCMQLSSLLEGSLPSLFTSLLLKAYLMFYSRHYNSCWCLCWSLTASAIGTIHVGIWLNILISKLYVCKIYVCKEINNPFRARGFATWESSILLTIVLSLKLCFISISYMKSMEMRAIKTGIKNGNLWKTLMSLFRNLLLIFRINEECPCLITQVSLL